MSKHKLKSKERVITDRSNTSYDDDYATSSAPLATDMASYDRMSAFQDRTVGEAVRAHVAHLRDRGLRVSTIDRAEAHLRRFFELDALEGTTTVRFAHTGGMLAGISAQRCAELYATLSKHVAVDTHRNALAAVKAFGTWCVSQGWLYTNPAAGVTPIGQRSRGKKQLNTDDTRKLVALCVAQANTGDDAAVGVLTALLMGMRASEVTDRVVGDLETDGRLLWIEVGKTKRERRTVEVPELLQPYLIALAKDRGPDEQLITRDRTKRGNRCDRQWLRYGLAAFCREASVPRVCTHSLRGLREAVAAGRVETPQDSNVILSSSS